jgi:glutathione gamma-glutamylcysteinyltransferase
MTTTKVSTPQSSSSSTFSPSLIAKRNSFYKRPLPGHLVSLSSDEGKKLFKEALDEGGMEAFFALSEQFTTQSEPEFCAVSSLVMVLNALSFDPKKRWKGGWRWVSEEMLQCASESKCGHSLLHVKENGMNFSEFVELASCHNVSPFQFITCILDFSINEYPF